jgi:hypothetical protein
MVRSNHIEMPARASEIPRATLRQPESMSRPTLPSIPADTLCDVWLLDLEGLTVLRCRPTTLNERGLSASVPIGSGLTAGQCFRLRVCMRPAAPNRPETQPESLWLSGAGTIVRTEVTSDRGQYRLAFDLRLDTPLAP